MLGALISGPVYIIAYMQFLTLECFALCMAIG